MKSNETDRELSVPGPARIFFLHIPKTGGTTLTENFYRRFAPFGYLREVHENPDAKLRRQINRLPQWKLNHIRAILGHFHFGLHNLVPGDYHYVVLLREPRQRVQSLYCHILNNQNHPQHKALTSGDGLELFLSGQLSEQSTNDQTRRLAGFPGVKKMEEKHYRVAVENITNAKVSVGVTERFDEYMTLLEQQMPELGDLSYPYRRNTRTGPPEQAITAKETLRSIHAANHWDNKLYDTAVNVLDQRINQFGGQFNDLMRNFEERCQEKAQNETNHRLCKRIKRSLQVRLRNQLRNLYFRC